MSLRLEYFVVAENVSIDGATNQVSVFNILEEINTIGFPAILHQAVAVGLWAVTDSSDLGSEHQVQLKMRLPDGSDHAVLTNFTMTHRRQRVTQRLQGIPLLQEGTLEFEALLDGQHAAHHFVDVRAASSVASTAPGPTH